MTDRTAQKGVISEQIVLIYGVQMNSHNKLHHNCTCHVKTKLKIIKHSTGVKHIVITKSAVKLS